MTGSPIASRAVAFTTALLLWTGMPALAQPPAAPVLSLSTAVATAREQNRALRAGRLGVDKAVQELAAFRTQRKPLFDVRMTTGSLLAPLDFRFPMGAFGVFPTTGPIPPADATITTEPRLAGVVFANVTQPLTQLRRIGYGISAMTLARDIASERARARELEIVAGVKKLYYGIVQAEAGLRAREESVRLYRELSRVIDQYAAQQAVLPADVLSIRAGLLKQEHEAAALRNATTGYREQLNTLLARNIDEPFAVEPLLPAPVSEAELGPSETRALAERPDVRISRLESEQAAFDLRATQTPGMPDISVSFNYAGFYGFEVLPRHGALIGVLASWEPWDWGRKRAERAAKRLVHDQSALVTGEAEARVRVDVRARFRALQDAFSLVAVSDAARVAARERLRVTTERFGRDAALERELLESQAQLAQSDFDCQQALAAYWTARAELERARADQ